MPRRRRSDRDPHDAQGHTWYIDDEGNPRSVHGWYRQKRGKHDWVCKCKARYTGPVPVDEWHPDGRQE